MKAQTYDGRQLPPLPDVVARNVRAELARAGRDPDDVASALDVTRESAQRRITGKQEWRLSELDVIARLTRVDRSEFFRE